MVLRGSGALRFLRRRGLRLCRLAGRFPAVLRCLRLLLPVLGLLLRVLRLLLAPSTPTPRAPARLFRRRQILREPVRDLLDRAELLAGGVDELCCVLLVTVSARVCQRAEQAFCLGELGARAAILHLPGCAGESPDPAGEDLLGSVGLFLADRAQEDADALDAILLPGRRLGDERDEIVEIGALDHHRDAVGKRGHPQPAVRVLRGAGGQEGLERASGGAAFGELLRELDALVEADVAAGNRRPVPLLVLVEVARVDPLPLARDHAEPPLPAGGARHEPWRRREPSSGAALLPASRRRRHAR